uniref:Uncharacterized protein n=1 Tax=Rhizophora mucronata TaxID=61149 RepID=A0A2P2PA40_RHIMU
MRRILGLLLRRTNLMQNFGWGPTSLGHLLWWKVGWTMQLQ